MKSAVKNTQFVSIDRTLNNLFFTKFEIITDEINGNDYFDVFNKIF